MEQKFPKLRCNAEYKRLYQPMSEQEFEALERRILTRNDTVEIKTWNSIVLYDYEKYEICQKYKIPFVISRIYPRNSEEALLWLCKNQLERSDLTFEMRRYLIGKRFLYERILGAHDVALRRASSSIRGRPKSTESKYDDCAVKTQERLGREYNLSSATIWKYKMFAEAIDIICEISEDFCREILLSNLKVSQENVIAISRLTDKEVLDMAEFILRENGDFATFANSRKLMSKATSDKAEEITIIKPTTIKDMPKYDPDAEIASLTLTIPSWISSMKRVCATSNTSNISQNAKDKLFNELDRLVNAVFDMLDILKEEK